MDLSERLCEYVIWIQLPWDSVQASVGTVMIVQVMFGHLSVYQETGIASE
jgi:hypothetical protein